MDVEYRDATQNEKDHFLRKLSLHNTAIHKREYAFK